MHFIRYQVPAFLWFGVIYFLSSLPPSAYPIISIPHIDKVVHAGIFFILCVLVDRAVTHQTMFPRLARFHLLVAIAAVILYGLIDEFHQSFVPGRGVDLLDTTADVAGGCLYLFMYSFRKIRTP